MAYATLAQFRDDVGSGTIYAKLTDRNAGTTPSDAVGQEIVDQAHGELNGWIARRFATPIDCSADATLAQTLRAHVLAIAAYLGWSKAYRPGEEIPKRIVDAYERTLEWLKTISDGKNDLPGAAPPAASQSTTQTAEAVGFPRVCTPDAMNGLI